MSLPLQAAPASASHALASDHHASAHPPPHASIHPAVHALMMAAAHGWILPPPKAPSPAANDAGAPGAFASTPAQRIYVLVTTTALAVMATIIVFVVAGHRAEVSSAQAQGVQPVAPPSVAPIAQPVVAAPIAQPVDVPPSAQPVAAPPITADAPASAPTVTTTTFAPPPPVRVATASPAPSVRAPTRATSGPPPNGARSPGAQPRKLDDAARSAEMLRKQLGTAVN